MDERDRASGSCSEMKKKQKLDDSVDDEEVVVEDILPSVAEKDKEGHKAMAMSFIRAGMHPKTIKSPSFANYIRYLNPDFRPSVSLLVNEVLEVHEECKEKVKKFLKDFQGKLTLSYEWMVLGNEWTRDYIKGPVLHEDFVCITAHFIDDNWKVKKWILGYTTRDSVTLDDCYVYAFRNAVQGFEIENKVSTLLLPNDEGFSEETLGSFRKGIEDRGDNSISPPVFLVYCCADLFRLMVNDLYSDFRWSLYEDLRMLVGWGRCSSTQWNLTVSNLQRAVDMKDEDAFSKDEIYDDYDKPSDEEWIKIRTFCKLVGCIYKVAVELFEGGYSTSNVYFHLLAELKVMLNQELENAKSADNDYFLLKAKVILKRFDKYWNHMFLLLATASVLDPRFKMKYLEFYCSKNQACDEASKTETVLDYLRDLYAGYAASDICQKPICPAATIESKEEEENVDGRGEVKEEDHDENQDGEEDDDDDDDDEEEGEEEDYDEEHEEEEDYDEEQGETNYDSNSSEEEERAARKDREKKPDACKDFAFFQEFLKFEGSPREYDESSELDSYLKEPVMEWNKDFKALDWWRVEGHKYPILSRVARDILSIPISRATSYDAYVSDRREPPELVVSLEAKVANAMMCTKRWLRL